MKKSLLLSLGLIFVICNLSAKESGFDCHLCGKKLDALKYVAVIKKAVINNPNNNENERFVSRYKAEILEILDQSMDQFLSARDEDELEKLFQQANRELFSKTRVLTISTLHKVLRAARIE